MDKSLFTDAGSLYELMCAFSFILGFNNIFITRMTELLHGAISFHNEAIKYCKEARTGLLTNLSFLNQRLPEKAMVLENIKKDTGKVTERLQYIQGISGGITSFQMRSFEGACLNIGVMCLFVLVYMNFPDDLIEKSVGHLLFFMDISIVILGLQVIMNFILIVFDNEHFQREENWFMEKMKMLLFDKSIFYFSIFLLVTLGSCAAYLFEMSLPVWVSSLAEITVIVFPVFFIGLTIICVFILYFISLGIVRRTIKPAKIQVNDLMRRYEEAIDLADTMDPQKVKILKVKI